MAIDEVKIEQRFEDNENKIQKLEINYARLDERFKNVENNQIELKNIITQNNSQVLSLLSQVLTNQSQEKINKDNNKNNIFLKIIALIGTVSGFLFGKSI